MPHSTSSLSHLHVYFSFRKSRTGVKFSLYALHERIYMYIYFYVFCCHFAIIECHVNGEKFEKYSIQPYIHLKVEQSMHLMEKQHDKGWFTRHPPRLFCVPKWCLFALAIAKHFSCHKKPEKPVHCSSTLSHSKTPLLPIQAFCKYLFLTWCTKVRLSLITVCRAFKKIQLNKTL